MRNDQRFDILMSFPCNTPSATAISDANLSLIFLRFFLQVSIHFLSVEVVLLGLLVILNKAILKSKRLPSLKLASFPLSSL